MKNTKFTLPALLIAGLLAYSCNKTSYTNTDHTVGLVNTTRSWSGYSTGFIKGDTLIPPATTVQQGALYFYHTINDSSFNVLKSNGYQISVMGTYMNYHSTDSTTHIVEFDTTFSGSPKSFLKYNYSNNSITMEYHWVGTFNAVTSRYYQTDIYLHTN